jgi:hypothetical protein
MHTEMALPLRPAEPTVFLLSFSAFLASFSFSLASFFNCFFSSFSFFLASAACFLASFLLSSFPLLLLMPLPTPLPPFVNGDVGAMGE